MHSRSELPGSMHTSLSSVGLIAAALSALGLPLQGDMLNFYRQKICSSAMLR